MPRPERPLNSDDGPVPALAAQLRELRRLAGTPKYRELAERAGYSVATLANAAGGRQLPSLAVTLAFVRACGGDPAVWQRRWQQAAAEHAAMQAGTAQPGSAPNPEDPPYRGLMGYGVADADWFFGRDWIVGRLVEIMRRQCFVAVFGASGSGKSSLLRAGLIPAVRDAGYLPVLVTPGAQPLAALRLALRQQRPDREVLLVVDQFEELFTLCRDPVERSGFVDELAALVEGPTSNGPTGNAPTANGPTVGGTAAIGPEAQDPAGTDPAAFGPTAERRAPEEHQAAGRTTTGGTTTGPAADHPAAERRAPEEHRAPEQPQATGRTTTGGTTTGGPAVEARATAGRRAGGRKPAARPRIRVVIGVRADFYARCTELPTLARLLAWANVPVGPPAEEELRQVVTEPARRAGLSVERALTTKVLADAAGQPGALPLVSHALLETWRHRRSDMLTLAGYEAAGGMAGAIAQTAETVYQRLDARQQETARHVLTRLVTLGEGVQDTRRRVDRAELRFPEIDKVLHELACARLIVLDQNTVDIAHEALIEAWPRLHDWLHTDRQTLRLHRQVIEDSRVWDSLGRDTGALYRGARLAMWDGLDSSGLNPLEQAFLSASRERAADRAEARRRRTRRALTVLTAAAAVMTVLAALALVQTWRAGDQRDLALSRQLVANSRAQSQVDQEVALLLAIEAYDTKPTAEAQAALRQAVVESRLRAVVRAGQGRVFGVSFSPDGGRLAASGADGTVRLWRRAGSDRWQPEPRVLRAHTGEVYGVAFSADGRWLAAGGTDRTVSVWDLPGGGPPLVLRGHRDRVRDVAFSPDGRSVASSGDDGTVRVWDRAGGRPLRVLALGSPALGVAYSRDGRHLAASATGRVCVWDGTGGGRPRVFTDQQDAIKDVEFSPDGRRLASVGADHTIRVRTLDGRRPPVLMRTADDAAVESVAFSPDGTRLATTHSGSDTIRVWNADRPDDPLLLRGHDEPVWKVAFSPDGRRLASASGDGTVRFWDPGYPGGAVVLRGHRGSVWTAVMSRDGRRVASSGEDGTVRIFNADGTGTPLVLRGHSGEVLQVAFSPDGKRAVSGGRDGTVRVWDTVTGRQLALLRGHTGAAISVDFSPDGRRVVSAGSKGDATVRVWNADGTGTPLVLRGHTDLARYVAFSPDGRHLASTDNAGVIRVWNADGSGAPVLLRGHPVNLVWCVRFSPDGSRVASGGQDGSLRIWNTDGRGDPLVLTGQRAAVWSVDFSPDGRRLASVGDSGGLRIWDATSGTELVSYQGHGASVESLSFAPDGHRLVTAHGDGTVRVWDCEVCRPIDQVRALAATRVTRALTPQERTTFVDRPAR